MNFTQIHCDHCFSHRLSSKAVYFWLFPNFYWAHMQSTCHILHRGRGSPWHPDRWNLKNVWSLYRVAKNSQDVGLSLSSVGKLVSLCEILVSDEMQRWKRSHRTSSHHSLGASILENWFSSPSGVMPEARRNTFTSPFWNGPAIILKFIVRHFVAFYIRLELLLV